MHRVVTISAYKMIWTCIATQEYNFVLLLYSHIAAMCLHGLSVATRRKQKRCELGCKAMLLLKKFVIIQTKLSMCGQVQ